MTTTEAPKVVDTSVQYNEGAVKPLDLGKEAARAATATETTTEPAPLNPLTAAFAKAMQGKPVEAEAVEEVTDKVADKVTDKVTDKPADKPVFTGKKAADWNRLHESKSAAEARAAKLEGDLKTLNDQLAEARKQPVVDPEAFKALQTERQDLLDRMEKVALQYDPRFEAHFSKLEGAAVQSAKEAVGEENSAAVEALMQLPPSKARKEQLNSIMAGMDNELDKVSLAQAVREMDAARKEKTEKLNNSKTYVAQLRAADAQENDRQQALRVKSFESAAEEAVKFAATLSAFQPIEGATAHNEAIANRQAQVRNAIMGKVSPTEARKMPALAAEAEFLRKDVVPALLEENKRLRESVAAMTAADPALVGRGEKGQTAGKEPDFISSYNKHMGGK